MIISPHRLGLTIRQPVTMSRDQAQFFLDFEVFAVGLGMIVHLRCIRCALAREYAACGCSMSDDARTVMVECRCRTRTYDQGELTAPTPPRPLVKRQDAPDGEKHHERLARDAMAQIAAYEALLKSLDLEGGLVCMRCDETVRRTRDDASQYTLECRCTTRSSPLAPVAVSSH